MWEMEAETEMEKKEKRKQRLEDGESRSRRVKLADGSKERQRRYQWLSGETKWHCVLRLAVRRCPSGLRFFITAPDNTSPNPRLSLPPLTSQKTQITLPFQHSPTFYTRKIIPAKVPSPMNGLFKLVSKISHCKKKKHVSFRVSKPSLLIQQYMLILLQYLPRSMNKIKPSQLQNASRNRNCWREKRGRLKRMQHPDCESMWLIIGRKASDAHGRAAEQTASFLYYT